MRYTEEKFTLPVSEKVSQKEWDRIFGKKPKKKKDK
jgi:hypothetical protein